MVSTKVSVEHHADPRKSKRGIFPGAKSNCWKLTQRRSEGGLALEWKAQVVVGRRSESDALVRDRRLTPTRLSGQTLLWLSCRVRCPGGVLEAQAEPRGGDCHQEHRPPFIKASARAARASTEVASSISPSSSLRNHDGRGDDETHECLVGHESPHHSGAPVREASWYSHSVCLWCGQRSVW
jgi:hypothetical protein